MTSMDAATYQAASVPCRYISFIYYGYGLLLHVEYNGRIIYRFVQHAQRVSALTGSVELLCLALMSPSIRPATIAVHCADSCRTSSSVMLQHAQAVA